MNLIGAKNIETDRLLLKIPTMKEQYDLWNILKDTLLYFRYYSEIVPV